MDSGRRWWLIVVAGIVAGVYLCDSVGYEAGGALIVATIAGALGWRWYRKRNPPAGPSVRCVRCGATLSATARNCNQCGSASWTYIN